MKTLWTCGLGFQPYGPVHALQERLLDARREGRIPDTLLLVEHAPVLTLGRRGREEHILSTEAELRQQGFEIFRTGRGGDVTYHGPGQLVGYPIFDLAAHGLGVAGYVGRIEEVLIRGLAGFGIRAGTDPINRGVWVGPDKIAAIGVRVSRHISMHGFALNVTVDLSHYRHIVPCGIRGRGVSSMHLLVPGVTVGGVAEALTREFASGFGFESVESISVDRLNAIQGE